jgi:ADP-ribose pyrophosphatase
VEQPGILADHPAEAEVSDGEILAKSFRDFVGYKVKLRTSAGTWTTLRRELLRVGPVVAVLPVDLARREVVLIRQFRLAAHLALGRGEMVEIVAGHVEAGEEPIAAARRECGEEIGVIPDRLVELLRFMPAPGMVLEYATLFLGSVDATQVPEHAGAANEAEDTRPIRVPIDAAVAALSQGTLQNGYLIIALQWLALNRDRLDDILQAGTAR